MALELGDGHAITFGRGGRVRELVRLHQYLRGYQTAAGGVGAGVSPVAGPLQVVQTLGAQGRELKQFADKVDVLGNVVGQGVGGRRAVESGGLSFAVGKRMNGSLERLPWLK